MFQFEEFPKIPRMKKAISVTEKIDGTNAQVAIFALDSEEKLSAAQADSKCTAVVPGAASGDLPLDIYAGSRNRWITPGDDNFGFAAWVHAHVDELVAMGEGRHFGEWYGRGIQSHYFLDHRRFALFNTNRWLNDPKLPACCSVVPVLGHGEDLDVDAIMEELKTNGSKAVPGFMAPEGIVVFHTASRQYYKRTFKMDTGKWSGT